MATVLQRQGYASQTFAKLILRKSVLKIQRNQPNLNSSSHYLSQESHTTSKHSLDKQFRKKCTQTTPKDLLNPLVCLKSKIVSIFEKRLKLNVEELFRNLLHMKSRFL